MKWFTSPAYHILGDCCDYWLNINIHQFSLQGPWLTVLKCQNNLTMRIYITFQSSKFNYLCKYRRKFLIVLESLVLSPGPLIILMLDSDSNSDPKVKWKYIVLVRPRDLFWPLLSVSVRIQTSPMWIPIQTQKLFVVIAKRRWDFAGDPASLASDNTYVKCPL